MPRLVYLDDVWRMLDDCLAGHERTQKPHRWNVKHDGRVYYNLPLGEHGRRQNPEIEAGHVRGLVRFFTIPKNCYEQHLDLS